MFGTSVGTTAEKGPGGMVEMSSRRGDKEGKDSDQKKAVIEEKWREILRESKELEKRVEKGETNGEKTQREVGLKKRKI